MSHEPHNFGQDHWQNNPETSTLPLTISNKLIGPQLQSADLVPEEGEVMSDSILPNVERKIN
jgi:hypothetical protein